MQRSNRGITPTEIRQLVGCDDPVILEIGCNDGKDTAAFLRGCPGARIYCFEPDPRPLNREDGFWSRFTPEHPQVTLFQLAIGERDGKATFYASSGEVPAPSAKLFGPQVQRDWDMSGSLFEPTGHLDYSPWVTFPAERQLEVDVARLDTWIELHPEIDRIDFLWADTQGAEAALIAGGRDTLLRLVRFFYTEYYDSEMYANQPCLAEICAMLPNTYELLGTYSSDNALFANRKTR